MLTVGEPAPWFEARSPERENYHFSQAAGRYVAISFLGSAAPPDKAAMLEAIHARADIFNDGFAAFYAVSSDPNDERLKRLKLRLPGMHAFWDFDASIAAQYGLVTGKDGKKALQCATFVLDRTLRVLAILPIRDGASHAAELIDVMRKLPAHPQPGSVPAPVLVVPRVFEPEFCKLLMFSFQKSTPIESGFMVRDPATGRTVLEHDRGVKRRSDVELTDAKLQQQIVVRLQRRLIPEVRKVFQYHGRYIERFVVARYDSASGGFFRPHRDNTTKGTAHRGFAVTINLNAEEYEGGDLCFPEFDRRTYRAPTGGAVVFSCSLLHEAKPVTRGVRYAFLPFLYDEAGAKLREQNLNFVAPLDIPNTVN